MVVDSKIINELEKESGYERVQRANVYVYDKRVRITKVIYDDNRNFEVHSNVKGNTNDYDVIIKAMNGELESLDCTCIDCQEKYNVCKHILATIQEFNANNSYVKIFSGQEIKESNLENNIYNKRINNNKHDDNYRVFKQLINSFKYTTGPEIIEQKIILPHTIKLIPKLIYNSYAKVMKLELKIGDKHLYKLKDLAEFYTRMIDRKYYEYGIKLGFVHEYDAFEIECLPILNYTMKYSEIIKYANDNTKEYTYYGLNSLSNNFITISNSGIDELFEIMKNKSMIWQKDGKESNIYFDDSNPNIKFEIEEIDEKEYKVYPNTDIYEYEIIKGREYVYLLIKNNLYRCTKEFEENELKILEIFRNNFQTEIIFPKTEIKQFFSLVFPKIRNSIETKKVNQIEIQQYIPKELFVKVFLDYDKNNYILADIKFVYGNEEFNPLLEQNIISARDLVKEDEVLSMFQKSGFMLDIKNARLVLASEEAIYNFLSIDVEEYMQKFEVLATNTFKEKEIKEPKLGTIGVKIENNLLSVDFSKIDFDINELQDIMKQYKLKKKYYRLKNGSFINLDNNEDIKFIESITENIDIDYSKMKEGELKLPIYRSMYLDRLLNNIKNTNVVKDDNYKQLINKIEEKSIKSNLELPSNLNASLREYQKIGYEWLNVLDDYNFGGILADDMGLGKTLQVIAVIQKYTNENKDSLKPSIVVCPSSLTLNWENEIHKFAPELTVQVIRGSLFERKSRIKDISKYNVSITSYDLLKRDLDLYEELNHDFKYIIADEAQYIKNNNTQNAKAIKKINAETRFALTGTPIENSLAELWSIFDFVMPGYLFGYRKFKENYELPIAKGEDEEVIKKLKMLIEPFILRRIKSEVLTELPDKTISVLNNEMRRRTTENICILYAKR